MAKVMTQSIFIPKVPETPPVIPPIAEVIPQTQYSFPGLEIVYWVLGAIIAFFVIRMVIRFLFEIALSPTLVYAQISLPRSDSKLDKEHETKKDFKEKIGIMNLVHNAIWKISTTSLRLTILNFIFNYIKISYEIIYKE